MPIYTSGLSGMTASHYPAYFAPGQLIQVHGGGSIQNTIQPYGANSTATTSLGGYGGYYPAQQIDTTHVERENAKYDGIMQGYWEMVVAGYDLPWTEQRGAYDTAVALVRVMRAPQPHIVVRMTAAHTRKPDWLDAELAEIEAAATVRYNEAYAQALYNAREATSSASSLQNALQQAATQQNTWGGNTTKPPSWLDKIIGAWS